MVTSTAFLNAATSNCPLPVANFIRFSEARLQAVSSRNIYSEHGLLALIRAVFFEVCQRFTVVSYCIPGSPQCQVESAIFIIRSRARSFSAGWPSVTFFLHPFLSSPPARMTSSDPGNELFAYGKKIEAYASPSMQLS